jgi:hypothetical protein
MICNQTAAVMQKVCTNVYRSKTDSLILVGPTTATAC